MDALVLEEVSKSFGPAGRREAPDGGALVRAVDCLSALVPTGCIYGFLGPNGAGKTTTLRMIMNIIIPDAGRIEVLGQAASVRAGERMGYMPEERGLYRKMKVGALLRYIGALKGLARADAARGASEWLERVGLGAWAERRVEELSRGNQQKLQFAVTAIGDPEILILDEPFSGLDPVNLEVIKGIMVNMREAGKTVIFSTHMMDHAQRLCDFILLIDRGRKVVDGRLEEIQARYRSRAVCVEIEGDCAFVRELPLVTDVKAVDKRLEITLREDADEQALLKALVGRCRVKQFALKTRSLHEIFVSLVGSSDA